MRRFLLLGVAVVASGALLVGTVGAVNTGSTTTTAGPVSPSSVDGLVDALLSNPQSAIVANGVFHVVGDIQVRQLSAGGDDAYQLRTTNATTDQGDYTGYCGTWRPKYDTTFGQIGVGAEWASTGTLRLQIQADANVTCSVYGAVVTVTYEAF